MFDIYFVDNQKQQNAQGKRRELEVKLVLGKVTDTTVTVLDYWDATEYHNQWCQALKRLSKHDKSVIITNIPAPDTKGYVIEVWPIFKVGKELFIQNWILSYKYISKPYGLKEIYEYIDESRFDDEASFWNVTNAEIEDWLTKNNPKKS